jgi:hypothetical protein
VWIKSPSYKGHRYPVEIISHCVWLYFRWQLSRRRQERPGLGEGASHAQCQLAPRRPALRPVDA